MSQKTVFLTVLGVIALGLFGYRHYAQSSAENAAIAYVCQSNIIAKVTTIIGDLRSGVTPQNFGQQSIEDLYKRGLQMAQQVLPISNEIKANPSLAKHQGHFNRISKSEEKEKSKIYLSLARKASQTCPSKASDLGMTAEAISVIVASFKR